MGERKPRGPGSPEGFPGGLTQPCPQGRRPEKKECPKGRILVLGKHRSSVSREYRRGKTPSASGQRNAGRWLAGARFLQVLNWVQFGIREGFWQG